MYIGVRLILLNRFIVMKRILVSFFISIVFHIAVFAALVTVQLLEKPQKRITNIMYIKPVKINKVKNPITKTEPKKVQTKKIVAKKIITTKLVTKNNGIKKTVKKKDEKKPIPKVTPTPYPSPETVKSAIPIKKVVKKTINKKIKTKAEIEEEAKVTILKKYPYFKNWSAKRLKRLELPPGMKSWTEAVKLTEYLDKEYNWVGNPPNLGNEDTKIDPNKNPYQDPTPKATPTDDPNTPEWKEYKENKTAKIYAIHFYYENIGFIASINEDNKKVTTKYFPFDLQKAQQEATDQNVEIEIKISPETKKEDIKELELPLTKIDIDFKNDPQQDKKNKDQLVRDILRSYRQTLSTPQ